MCMKLFKSSNIELIKECQRYSRCLPPSLNVKERCQKFISKYENSVNTFCEYCIALWMYMLLLLLLQMSWITVLPSHSCGGTLQNLDLKSLHSSMQTSADHRSRRRHVRSAIWLTKKVWLGWWVVSVFFILLFVCMFVFSFCVLPFWWIKMSI